MNEIPLWIYLKRYFRPDTDETTSTFMCDSYLKQKNISFTYIRKTFVNSLDLPV